MRDVLVLYHDDMFADADSSISVEISNIDCMKIIKSMCKTEKAMYLLISFFIIQTIRLYNNQEEISVLVEDFDSSELKQYIFDNCQLHSMSEMLRTLSSPIKHNFSENEKLVILNEYNNTENHFYQSIKVLLKESAIEFIFQGKYIHDKTMVEAWANNFEKCVLDFALYKGDVDKLQLKPHSEEKMVVNNNKVAMLSLIEDSFINYKNRVALKGVKKELFFGDVEKLCIRLAAYLELQRIKKDEPVIIYSNGTDSTLLELPLVYALWRVGAIVIPISYKVPEAVLSNIIKETGVNVVFSNRELKIDSDVKCILLNELENKLECIDECNEKFVFGDVEEYDERTAFIIFTSGSTGKPKGVVVPFKALNNMFDMNIDRRNYGDGCNVLALLSWGFDAATHQYILEFVLGNTLILNGDYTKEGLKEILENVNVLITLPTMADYMLQQYDSEVFNNIRYVTFGGEKIEESTYAMLKKKAKNVKVILNNYGPTEATVCVGIKDLTLHYSKELQEVENVKCEVFDKNRKRLPYGAHGELYIKGANLTNGYLDEAETSKNFVWVDGELYYKTGDRAYGLTQNSYVICGRISDSDYIKVNGFRVDLNQINNAASSYLEAIVARTLYIEKKIVLFYSSKNAEIVKSNFVDYLVDKLPEYAIPADIIKVDAFPMTTNGKLDSKRLEELYFENHNESNRDENTVILPEISIEAEKLMEILSDTCKINQDIDIHTPFSKINLNSIDFMSFLSALSQNAINVSARELLAADTLYELAAVMNQKNVSDISKDHLYICFIPMCADQGFYYEFIKNCNIDLDNADIHFYPSIPDDMETLFSEYMNMQIAKIYEEIKNYDDVYFIGHSIGGKVAYYIASKLKTDKKATNINSILIFDTTPDSEKDVMKKIKRNPLKKIGMHFALDEILGEIKEKELKKLKKREYMKALDYIVDTDIECMDDGLKIDIPMLVLKSEENTYDLSVWENLDVKTNIVTIEDSIHTNIQNSVESARKYIDWLDGIKKM